jgi:hypothetical protein
MHVTSGVEVTNDSLTFTDGQKMCQQTSIGSRD